MEQILDWKRIPLLFIGEKSECIQSAAIPFFTDIKQFFASVPAPDRNNFYLLLDSSTLLPALQKEKFPSDQILLFVDSSEQLRNGDFFLLEKATAEKSDEFRQRIQSSIEIVKQKKIDHAIFHAFENKNLTENVEDTISLQMRISAAHLSHALCIALKVAPSTHSKTIELSLQNRSGINCENPASVDQPMECLISDCALLVLLNTNVQIFRQKFRHKTASLNFRQKTELKNAIDRCSEHLWEGHTNAA